VGGAHGPALELLAQAVTELDGPAETKALQGQAVASLGSGGHNGPDPESDLVDRALQILEGGTLQLPGSDLGFNSLQSEPDAVHLTREGGIH